MSMYSPRYLVFFFNDTATTEIYTLSLHDALPICTDGANRYLDHGNYLAYGLGATATWVLGLPHGLAVLHGKTRRGGLVFDAADLVKDAAILPQDRKSTRPNSSHLVISYAVFCLKKNNNYQH